MMDMIQSYLAGILIVIGAAFALIASIGLLRLPDLYTRMHAASKAGTMGSGIMLIALAIYTDDQAVLTRALAGVIFFLLTAPVSSHLLAKAAYAAGYPMWDGSVRDEMKPKATRQRRKPRNGKA
ncbi:Na+/H+ antiporter subunit G [Mesorhizobium sp. NBSH29]|uniref:monovalent cation/H(+) antiporter subunit G n=1 Tax=Mesorhizobium sp. NBSH29 TaxID=2654249 RepID=UPI0018969664|nr:monovalent cation/H(+) antiporter subunit G [Mesorhizobium sp. NBSH29]QPC87183.1 Na+/H+ antiporter subunit G [Mesorhizobium sp. NBSH29]